MASPAAKEADQSYQDNRAIPPKPQARPLRLHELKGEFAGTWSISAGGDLRIHFRYHGDTVVFFLAVGTHSQLY